jgi:hypothetical protein
MVDPRNPGSDRLMAPPWLPRSRRRAVDRDMRKLLGRGVCSFCGRSFKPDDATCGGFDAHGNTVLTSECCIKQVAKIWSLGLDLGLTGDQLTAAYREATDDAKQRAGIKHPLQPNPFDSAWKDDDRQWFEQNPSRAHRIRPPFPGEADEAVAEAPAGCQLLMLVRQIEPGRRVRARYCLDTRLLPLPDDETAAHALFEIAVENEPLPRDGRAFCDLIEKYIAHGRTGQ